MKLEGLPEGVEAVAVRYPQQHEFVYSAGGIWQSQDGLFNSPELIVQPASGYEFIRFIDGAQSRLWVPRRAFTDAESFQIAKVAHEANRAYCFSLGDGSQLEWDEAPQWQRDSAVNGVRFHLSVHAETGQPPAASASHEAWLKEKREQGWKHGPVKDPDKKEHPCFVPYEQLPLEQRLKDHLFGAIVAAFFAARG